MNTSTVNDIYVEGVKLYPTSVDPTYSFADLQASGVRSWETGIMKLNPIRNDVLAIDLQWTDIPQSEANKILQQIKPQSDGASNITAYSPLAGAVVNMRMYRSDRKIVNKVYKGGVHCDLSFSLIEL